MGAISQLGDQFIYLADRIAASFCCGKTWNRQTDRLVANFLPELVHTAQCIVCLVNKQNKLNEMEQIERSW